MTVPPFPSQDLAKLVLGYLAEEQLMTAYDEFLHASPYLDALRNEYDRIFMTSLRNILAEYRAVKIFVETCKPFVLRKKLVQCSNLLEIVKFLVNHVDANKLHVQDVTTDKISVVKQNIIVSTKQGGCDACNSSNASNCMCKSRQSNAGVHTSQNIPTNTSESSVEATALEDLPGSHVTTRKKHVRVLEKETILLESDFCHNSSSKHTPAAVVTNVSGQSLSNSNVQVKNSESLPTIGLNSIVKVTNTPECREKIEEFNNILSQVCKGISGADNRAKNITTSANNKISNTTTFQDFASGVCGNENRHVPVPDSSTSENTSVLITKVVRNKTRNYNTSSYVFPKKENTDIEACYSKAQPKPVDQKIKILSDIKVDSPYSANNNATSTPLLQTIVINGTQAYNPKPPGPDNYTKDEIMAMPTIIVVPSSGQANPPQSQCGVLQKLNTATITDSAPRRLGPLVIDVSSNHSRNQTILNVQNPGIETGLVKTVDLKNASVPKENTISCATETNTPQVLPPLRKSSSTPRRNSHIRVLDFTTPRRILHETINEHPPNVNTSDKPTNTGLPEGSCVTVTELDKFENKIVDMNTVEVHKINSSDISIAPTKEHKKRNWDADLRALAIANDIEHEVLKPDGNKAKKKSKKKPEDNDNRGKKTEEEDAKKSRPKKKVSPKGKKAKRKRKIEEEEEDDSLKIIEGTEKVPVKPTIKIISCDKYGNQVINKDNEIKQNKSNSDEANETPEAERISLQNEIGAKLNISDLLETPYKQVLYDIQMETPRFLNPDIPDMPVSDIKIMNIPTPRFFDASKATQATPSSYSSRPTDYSSGGSYYKPDDQDYMPDDLDCLVSSSKKELSSVPLKVGENDGKKTRPVRKCTKNVSYFNSTNVSNKNKDKDTEDREEIASSCSDSTVANNSVDKKEVSVKTPRSNKPKHNAKTDAKKKVGSSKKHKSPIKRANTFMKIKPRRPTPTKESYGRHKRKSDTNLSKTQTKKKGNGKDKNAHVLPTIICAPTKSRRKSSTPRKLHCTKTFNSESSGHDSPEIIIVATKENAVNEPNTASSHDSDTEHIALRWSDDGSQDGKPNAKSPNEIEDIKKIQEYIETTAHSKPNYTDGKGALHVDLIKRGFDAETAKIIERDLLDTPPHIAQLNIPCHVEIIETKKEDSLDKNTDNDNSSGNDLQIDQSEEIEDNDIELSVHECNVESNNYVTACHDETKDTSRQQTVKLKDKFCMEICIDDGVAIRLRANELNCLFNHDPSNVEEVGYSFKETEVAVSSISNIDKLYTPLKDPMKATCYEIFDSTLTSLDTPLKPCSPRKDLGVTEVEVVVLDDKLDNKEKSDSRKRKRLQNSSSPEQNDSDLKKTKSEAQYLFNSTNIQNIDIESVLKKLHGP